MHRFLVEMLECPACHGELSWQVAEKTRERIVSATAHCRSCEADYPVREEIGVFLTPDLPRNDLWESGGRHLTKWLHDHPDLAARLMDGPIGGLGAADLFFRSLVHEERGEFAQAQQIFDTAWPQLYTKAYRTCFKAEIDHVVERVQGTSKPIVDLASGRGYLVTELLRGLSCQVVATDFSPRILQRDRIVLKERGLADRVSLLAFDARRAPFRDQSIETMTTLLGLPNIQQPGELLKELRRIISGELLAISHFYPADDKANLAALRDFDLVETMTREAALRGFEYAGWNASLENECQGIARPTPIGEILAGAAIDALPVAETTLDWGVIEAS